MNKEYIKTEVDDLVYRPLEIMEEKNTHDLRWLKKADGSRVLQERIIIRFRGHYQEKWVDIDEVEDEQKS